MSLTLISPLASIRLPDMGNYLDTFRADAGDAVLAGEAMSKETAAEITEEPAKETPIAATVEEDTEGAN